ncbi:RNA methyltransferase [Legionella jamestowniensis]|uniref:tRNA (cytidine/uridine-2'-O-)-methyltransferase TrmJ n=1 Tax=Legionella jamestowniensis TaxID=455 RepID=A0A0W0UH71_9GAMM|nr:RNA methyltransferase [Legionella jamestowniensis]KTD07208.1 RNA methyltransferase [Legionella jamestowniensis]OCH98865.1 tRNA (cytosine(32)/uridine(32)-2'-O)-methyltransferase TrmJ [Legionella jamestowniensis]SFL72201.1 tRNA (cytidine32/uridine32-2'-O)-methyltransferase [Legionella jamestowniensis DSM 19215]
MNFSTVRIVLIATSHPGNIGSTARAMKTMGFSNLYLVSPKAFPHQKAYEMAAGADDVLNNVVVTNSLDEALKGCQLIFATSARPRGIALPGLTPSEFSTMVAGQPDNTEIAILFGREHSGLTNEELLRSHYHINIPSNPEYSSLNLSQAVQIIAYELRMKLLSPAAEVGLSSDRLATADEVEQFFEHLKIVMVATKFLKPTRPTKRLLQRIRRIFNRSKLEYMEVTILRGILSHIQKALNNK